MESPQICFHGTCVSVDSESLGEALLYLVANIMVQAASSRPLCQRSRCSCGAACAAVAPTAGALFTGTALQARGQRRAIVDGRSSSFAPRTEL